MFSTLVRSEYADVFIDTTPNPTLQIIAYVVLGIALLLMIASIWSFEGMTMICYGLCIATVGICLMGVAICLGGLAENQIRENMVANVKEKYHAELQVTPHQIKELDKYQTYTLSFDNGATGEYRVKFEDSGEPMIAEQASAPSAEELNSDTRKPSTTQTPSPKSAKK